MSKSADKTFNFISLVCQKYSYCKNKIYQRKYKILYDELCKIMNNYAEYNFCHKIDESKEEFYKRIKLEYQNINKKEILLIQKSLKIRFCMVPSKCANKRLSYKNKSPLWPKISKAITSSKYINACGFCNTKKHNVAHENWKITKKGNVVFLNLHNIWAICNDCHNLVHFNNIFDKEFDKYIDALKYCIKNKILLSDYCSNNIKVNNNIEYREIEKFMKKQKDLPLYSHLCKIFELNDKNFSMIKPFVTFQYYDFLMKENNKNYYKFDKDNIIESIENIWRLNRKNKSIIESDDYLFNIFKPIFLYSKTIKKTSQERNK